MTMTHAQRRQLAQHLSNRLSATYADQLCLTGLYGSTARGTDTPWSDLEMWAVIESDAGLADQAFVYRGTAVGIEVYHREKLESALTHPTSEWPYLMGVLSVLEILHGDPTLVAEWLALGQSPSLARFRRALEEALPKLVVESYGRIQSCALRNDNTNLLPAVWEVLLEMNRALCLLNRRWVTHDYFQGLLEASAFPQVPRDYRRLVTALWHAREMAEIVPLAQMLYTNYVELVESSGLSFPDYQTVSDIPLKSKS